jgi:subtilisin family serine protease
MLRHLQTPSRGRLVTTVLALAVASVLAWFSAPASAAGAPPSPPAAAEDADIVKGHILVAPRAGVSDEQFHGAVNAHGGRVVTKLGDLDVYVVALPEHASERAVAALLTHHPRIKFAEPDQWVAPGLTPNDTYYGNAWHLHMVQASVAWDYALGNGITVAILDSGVNGTHPDLQGKMVPGWNFYDNNDNTADVHGHGTKVAGVVAATSNNATGVTSIAWNAKLMPIRISAPDGYATWSTVASGLNWAANNGARVANISYAVHGSSTVQSAAQYMKNKGGVVVNSAGNSGAFDAAAASDAMISVSATNSADSRTSWASWGAYVDVAAPGEGIWTTNSGGGYSTVAGTSFSSPLTAGIVALAP